jgi:mannose-1-phosphate guanylyltransferase / mannose-6-phosphate isomerase
MEKIHPLILCGGVGTRLWPLSRTEHPKQFQRIDGHVRETFFQATVERSRHAGFAAPIVAVGSAHVDTVLRQLDEIGVDGNIIAEPVARNTGPAVLAAALWLAKSDPTNILCVFPSDHLIKGDLASRVLTQRAAAAAGKIVLFGIEPRYPDTGFGYIVAGDLSDTFEEAFDVEKFVEKPHISIAEAMIAKGEAFWASGISMFRADRIIAEFERFDPQTLEAVRNALEEGETSGKVCQLEKNAMQLAASLPTETIVFEKSTHTILAPLDVIWSDVGAWNALHNIAEKDQDGNALSGDVVCLGTTNSYVRSSGKLIAVIGMDNVVVVETDDAMLVMAKDQAQNVKTLVGMLQLVERREINRHMRNQENWGEVHLMQKGPGYELRLLKLRQSACMTIQRNDGVHRMLTVTEGAGLLNRGARVTPLMAGQSFEVAAGEAVVVFSGNETEMQLVEVQSDFSPNSKPEMRLDNQESDRLVEG